MRSYGDGMTLLGVSFRLLNRQCQQTSQSVFLTRLLSNGASATSSSSHVFRLDVFEFDSSGHVEVVSKGREDLVRLMTEANLPIRDFRWPYLSFNRINNNFICSVRLFFQPPHSDSLPQILSRPSSDCFILSLEHVRLLCQKEKCIVLGTEDDAVKTFVADLKGQLRRTGEEVGGEQSSRHDLTMHIGTIFPPH